MLGGCSAGEKGAGVETGSDCMGYDERRAMLADSFVSELKMSVSLNCCKEQLKRHAACWKEDT